MGVCQNLLAQQEVVLDQDGRLLLPSPSLCQPGRGWCLCRGCCRDKTTQPQVVLCIFNNLNGLNNDGLLSVQYSGCSLWQEEEASSDGGLSEWRRHCYRLLWVTRTEKDESPSEVEGTKEEQAREGKFLMYWMTTTSTATTTISSLACTPSGFTISNCTG